MKHAEAIERLKGRFMTVSMCATSAEAKAENEAIDMALAALREKQTRESGCVWCKGNNKVFHDGQHFHFFCSYCGKRLEVEP